MTDIFRELQNSCKRGVILFAKDGWSYGPDGTLWTKSGHFIYYGDYKVEGNKHWFKLYDSGQRDHDGWYCYETSMKTCVKHVWICKSAKSEPAPTPTPTPDPTPRTDTYQGLYPVVKLYLEPGDRGENVTRLQNYINWYYNGAFFKECGPADGIYGKNTLRWVNKMLTEFFGSDEADGLVGPKTIAEMKRRGGGICSDLVLDISNFNDVVDFNKVKASGIKGVIVRCGLRHAEGGALDEDSKFIKYIKAAYNAGLTCGIYFFTEAINEAEGREEARYALNLWKKAGVPLHYPIGVDSENVFWKEDGKQKAGRANSGVISATRRTNAIYGFCDEIKKNGYEVMIYASTSWFNNQLNMSKLPYHVWCAQYYDICEYKGKYIMWQYTSTGNVNGINGVVDMNHCYYAPKKMDPPKDDPAPTPTPTPDKKSYTGAYPTAAEIKAAQVNGMCQACKDQSSWSYPSIYEFENDPTIEKSRKKSTCVTYVSCVLQRTGLFNSGDCLWHDGTGFGDGKVRGTKGLLDVTYYNNKKTLKDLTLETCDILFYDDNKSGEMGNGGHEEIFNGVRNGSKSYFYSGGTGSYHNTSNNNSEPNTRKVLAVARVKWRTYLKKTDRGEAVTKLQDYLNWYFDGAFYKECGPADGIFGENTHKWTVKMQTDFFGAAEADGTVGPKTIAKMRTVVK